MQSGADAAAIQDAVESFLDHVRAEPALQQYWTGVEERRHHRHAQLFFLQALGGPDLYQGELASAHGSLAIDGADFDRIAELLVECLREAGVSAGVIELARNRIDGLRPVIVTS